MQNYSPEVLEKRKAYNRAYYHTNKERRHRQYLKWYADKDKDHHMYNNVKSKATKYGILFAIDKEDVIVPEHCPICSVRLERGVKRKSNVSPSVDKIVPNLGYVKGNVAVICENCNRQKSDNTEATLLRLLTYVRNNSSHVG